jgi:hypothetical protein
VVKALRYKPSGPVKACNGIALPYLIMRVQVNQDGLKLNGTHQLVVNADVILYYWAKAYMPQRKLKML